MQWMPTDGLVQGRLTEQLQKSWRAPSTSRPSPSTCLSPRRNTPCASPGAFVTPTDVAYDAIAARAKDQNLLIYFRKEEHQSVIYAVPGQAPVMRPRWPLAIALFVATLSVVFFTGAIVMPSPNAQGPIDWQSGLTYALPLMAILLAHELGHFFVARRHRMAVSPPYFIPLPIVSLGTLGTVIAMLAPPKNRRHLLQMAAAGPLAGLASLSPFSSTACSPPLLAPCLRSLTCWKETRLSTPG